MIHLTEDAASKITVLLELNDFDPEVSGARLSVKSGGCSGLEYSFDLVENQEKNDRIFTSHDVKIFCDPKSYLYLRGTTIGYEDSMTSSGFVFDNPQAKKSCGCGTSFQT